MHLPTWICLAACAAAPAASPQEWCRCWRGAQRRSHPSRSRALRTPPEDSTAVWVAAAHGHLQQQQQQHTAVDIGYTDRTVAVSGMLLTPLGIQQAGRGVAVGT
jgi:hypothetical protein